MSVPQIVILGAGAAGLAAARTLAPRTDLTVTVVGRTGETPYTRMNIKGVAMGPFAPELIHAALPAVSYVADDASEVDLAGRRVRLASGGELPFDALIVATGSTPRTLDPAIAGDVAADRIITLHSLEDAVRMRAALEGFGPRSHVAIYGGGLTAAETASLLHAAGHGVTLISRSELPGVSAFGPIVAAELADDHARRVATYFGRTLTSIGTDAEERPVLTLDGGTEVTADLVVVALGTIGDSPAPWNGEIDVDDRQRTSDPGVYAAGGVTRHSDDRLGPWRIDHWEDSAAQGAHAAASALHDLGLGEDPGAYLPRSAHIAMVHGRAVAGIGYTHTAGVLQDGDEIVIVHELDGTLVGVSGIDAVATVYQSAPRLHASAQTSHA